jgi:hypothetical protein
MESVERQCLYCGKSLRGRIDKKFCDDACRNNFNNEQNSDENNLVRNINNILRKNRRILRDCIPENSETGRIKREQLSQKGYQFKFHTHLYETQKGQTYTFCYEYGYLGMDEEWLLIVKQKQQK